MASARKSSRSPSDGTEPKGCEDLIEFTTSGGSVDVSFFFFEIVCEKSHLLSQHASGGCLSAFAAVLI